MKRIIPIKQNCYLKSRSKKEIFCNRSLEQDIKTKLLKLGRVKPHQAVYVIKDLLGDKSATNYENQRTILERLHTAISPGEGIVVDLRENNDVKPKYEEFWNIAAGHIDKKTAVDDLLSHRLVRIYKKLVF